MTAVPDFKHEADIAAVNEACDGTEIKAGECTIDHLCPYCAALSKSILIRLNRAFLAGQESVSEAAKLQSPHRIG